MDIISAWHYDYKSEHPVNKEFVKVFNEMHRPQPGLFFGRWV